MRLLEVKWLIGLVVPLLTLPIGISALHEQGLCFTERRFVKQSEMIDVAIAYQIEQLSRIKFFEDNELQQNELLTQFTDIEDFKSKAPNCCTMIGNEENYRIYGWYGAFSGKVANAVALRFNVNFKNAQGIENTLTHKQEIPVSSCAKIEVEVFRNPLGRSFQ